MRGVGSETRKNLTGLVGSWGALRPKVFFDNWLLGTPLGGCQHASTFEDFEKKLNARKSYMLTPMLALIYPNFGQIRWGLGQFVKKDNGVHAILKLP